MQQGSQSSLTVSARRRFVKLQYGKGVQLLGLVLSTVSLFSAILRAMWESHKDSDLHFQL